MMNYKIGLTSPQTVTMPSVPVVQDLPCAPIRYLKNLTELFWRIIEKCKVFFASLRTKTKVHHEPEQSERELTEVIENCLKDNSDLILGYPNPILHEQRVKGILVRFHMLSQKIPILQRISPKHPKLQEYLKRHNELEQLWKLKKKMPV